MTEPLTKTAPEFMVRVRLPVPFPKGTSEDPAVRSAIDAIFAVKPPGFEVSWASKATWPTDQEGYTWVRLYCANRDDSLAYFLKEWQRLSKQVAELKGAIRRIGL